MDEFFSLPGKNLLNHRRVRKPGPCTARVKKPERETKWIRDHTANYRQESDGNRTDRSGRTGREKCGDAKPVEKPGLAFYGALALVGILALLVFFANVEGTRASAGMEITKSSWTLQSYSGMTGNLIPVLPGSDVTARFGPGGQVSGSAGCNQYVATYILKDYGITVSSVTETGCTAILRV